MALWILSSGRGEITRVAKSLSKCVCGDFHEMAKFMSNLTRGDIVLRYCSLQKFLVTIEIYELMTSSNLVLSTKPCSSVQPPHVQYYINRSTQLMMTNVC
ncbi:hypothetical protein YC2023_095093 [Brassica napus]